MNNSGNMQVSAIGMAWYREADYERLLQIFVDADRLPKLYSRWEALAEKGYNERIGQGQIVVKAYIEPDSFVDWCAVNGCNVDAGGRMKYASLVAAEFVRDNK